MVSHGGELFLLDDDQEDVEDLWDTDEITGEFEKEGIDLANLGPKILDRLGQIDGTMGRVEATLDTIHRDQRSIERDVEKHDERIRDLESKVSAARGMLGVLAVLFVTAVGGVATVLINMAGK